MVNDSTDHALLSDEIAEGKEMKQPSSKRQWPAVLTAVIVFFFALVIPATGSDPYDKPSQVNDGYGDFHKLFTDGDSIEE